MASSPCSVPRLMAATVRTLFKKRSHISCQGNMFKRRLSTRYGENGNIILMGSPGCGKTTVGRILATRLGLPVVDFDNDYLESHWNKTVADKLAEVGADMFVAAEGKALLGLDLRGTILSLSGSVPMHRPAMERAARTGLVVFLDVDGRDIASRLASMKVDRIVGAAAVGPDATVLDLLRHRQQFYEGAYDVRILCSRQEEPESITEKVIKALADYEKGTRYTSTRADAVTPSGQSPSSAVDGAIAGDSGRTPDFVEVVLQGLAGDGGLFVPAADPPPFSRGEWSRLLDATYPERALRVLERWLHPADDLHPSALGRAVGAAYGPGSFADEATVPVRHLQDNQYVVEVFHGPTASFKDAALQLMPQFFTQAVLKREENVRYLILVATSGDTGSAVLDGFSKYSGDSGTLVMVLYPENGVSDVQKYLMTAAKGDNVHVVGVDGDFDFCQTTIKGIFGDEGLRSGPLADRAVSLSAANSINWGRLLPQVVYHASAYLDLVKQGVLTLGDPCDLCIPTGNFGNILGAVYARSMGIPFRKFICASNENNVLTEFLQTGCYDLRHRHLHVTMAPAIDILKSSNLERFLFLATDGNGAEIQQYYKQLDCEKYFKVSAKVLDRIQSEFGLIGDWCKKEEYAASIKETLTETGYLMDPHTAVAKVAADRHRPRDVPLLLCATAHYGKFPADVLASLGRPTSSPPPSSGTAHPADCLRELEGLSARPGPHGQLRAALERPRLHGRTIPASREAVVREMLDFIGRVAR